MRDRISPPRQGIPPVDRRTAQGVESESPAMPGRPASSHRRGTAAAVAARRRALQGVTFGVTSATTVATGADGASDTGEASLGTTSSSADYALQYGRTCQRLFAGGALSTVTVSYDYEMVLATDQPVPDGYSRLGYWTPALEWGTLWTVAQELGIHGCAFADDATLQGPIRPDVIVTVSSLQPDELDASLGGLSCQFLRSGSGKCYPMVGSMTAQFVGNDVTAVQEYLLSVIKTQMNQNRVLSGAIQQTLFIGDRDSFVPSGSPSAAPTAAPGDGSTTGGSRAAAVAIGSSVTAAAALALLLGFALLVTRRHRAERRDHKSGIISEVDELEQAETGSSRHSTDSHRDESRSPVAAASAAPAADPSPLSVLDTGLALTGAASVVTDGTVGSGGETTTVSGSSGDSDAAVWETIGTTTPSGGGEDKTQLPPKPPQGPSKVLNVQQTLNARRKKKKKKKKSQAMIPHVSSRENIKAMETITEDNGEVDDGADGGDSDSEYSYETDESGSRSRDPSPCRSDAGGNGEMPTV